jgi:hypothetical protein
MGSVDKAPSEHLLTGTRSLWALNGKDLLNKTSIQAFTSPLPRGQDTKVLGSYGNHNELLTPYSLPLDTDPQLSLLGN